MAQEQDTPNKNERLALLLGCGWGRYKRHVGNSDNNGKRFIIEDFEKVAWFIRPADGDEPIAHDGGGCPDYTQWDRFPEMQEYVRGWESKQIWDLSIEIGKELDRDALTIWAYVTPTILGDAIDEVCNA